MIASKLFEGIEIENDIDLSKINTVGLTMNSEKVRRDSIFVCIKGVNVDGHDYAVDAVKCGAKLLVVDHLLPIDVSQVVVKDTRKAMSLMASNFYGNPRKNFKLVGITGTNGKTTSTYMIKNILENAGQRVGVIGTIGIMVGDKKFPSTLTTPDPIELHKTFKRMSDAGMDTVVMEVSAHAIALQKLAGVTFDVGILTNVTQDHLDFFKTFENYAQVKSDFVKPKYCKKCIVNIDDGIGKNINLAMQNCNTQNFELKSFGIKDKADISASNIKYSLAGTSFDLKVGTQQTSIHTKLIGEFNVYNALGSAGACLELGVDLQTIKQGLQTMDFVPGRINVIKLQNGANVVIDYAHTPDGLKNILSSVRQVTEGKVYSVFGCGGNRDASKRHIMGEVSGQLANFSVLTSDNPRLEQPEAIIKDIEMGISKITNDYICITDRVSAINYVLRELRPQDVAVIAGKGAEDYLDIGGKKIHYSDYETVNNESKKIFYEEQKC